MLSHATMGVVALVILWGNTLLVALATAKQALALLGRARAFEGAVRGRVVGPGPIAEHEVAQKGRLASGKTMSIVFHDCAFSSRSLGGEIEAADGARFVIGAGPAEVWVTEQATREAQRCSSTAAFEEAYAAARKVKGWSRSVMTSIEQGAEVFVAGEIAPAAGAPASVLPGPEGLLIATFDPKGWVHGRVFAALGGFIPAIFAGALGCTLLALTEPVLESTTSKIGGVAGLVFFLLVLPAGTAVRDWLRPPSRRFLRGRWEHPDPARASASAPAEQEAAL